MVSVKTTTPEEVTTNLGRTSNYHLLVDESHVLRFVGSTVELDGCSGTSC